MGLAARESSSILIWQSEHDIEQSCDRTGDWAEAPQSHGSHGDMESKIRSDGSVVFNKSQSFSLPSSEIPVSSKVGNRSKPKVWRPKKQTTASKERKPSERNRARKERQKEKRNSSRRDRNPHNPKELQSAADTIKPIEILDPINIPQEDLPSFYFDNSKVTATQRVMNWFKCQSVPAEDIKVSSFDKMLAWLTCSHHPTTYQIETRSGVMHNNFVGLVEQKQTYKVPLRTQDFVVDIDDGVICAHKSFRLCAYIYYMIKRQFNTLESLERALFYVQNLVMNWETPPALLAEVVNGTIVYYRLELYKLYGTPHVDKVMSFLGNTSHSL